MVKNKDDTSDIKNSYSMILENVQEKSPDWHNFYYSKMDGPCTRAAEEVTKKAYPEYTEGGKMSNTMTRTWYHAYMQEYENQLEQQKDVISKMSLEDRAHIAYEARHHARVQTRSQMDSETSLYLAQEADIKRYGHKDGPTFEWLMQANIKKGMSVEQSYEDIIRSALSTNFYVNLYISAMKGFESIASFASSVISSICNYVTENVNLDPFKGVAVSDNVSVTQEDINSELFKPK